MRTYTAFVLHQVLEPFIDDLKQMGGYTHAATLHMCMNSHVDLGIKRWFWNQGPPDTKIRSWSPRVEGKKKGREMSLHFPLSASSVSFSIKFLFLSLYQHQRGDRKSILIGDRCQPTRRCFHAHGQKWKPKHYTKKRHMNNLSPIEWRGVPQEWDG